MRRDAVDFCREEENGIISVRAVYRCCGKSTSNEIYTVESEKKFREACVNTMNKLTTTDVAFVDRENRIQVYRQDIMQPKNINF